MTKQFEKMKTVTYLYFNKIDEGSPITAHQSFETDDINEILDSILSHRGPSKTVVAKVEMIPKYKKAKPGGVVETVLENGIRVRYKEGDPGSCVMTPV